MNDFGKLFLRETDVAYTHAGVFNADDVCAAALLQYVFPSIEIRRVYTVPESAELAFDIGGGKFDHHKPNPKRRENDVIYSSFGLLWQELGSLVIPEFYVREFDILFVSKVDYADTTGRSNQLASLIRAMNPAWDSDENPDECFEKAVMLVTGMLKSYFDQYLSRDRGYKEVARLAKNEKNMIGPHTLRLPKYIPYRHGINFSKIFYVVYPTCRSDGKQYTIHLTTTPNDSFHRQLPEKWLRSNPVGTVFLDINSHIILEDEITMRYCVTELEQEL